MITALVLLNLRRACPPPKYRLLRVDGARVSELAAPLFALCYGVDAEGAVSAVELVSAARLHRLLKLDQQSTVASSKT